MTRDRGDGSERRRAPDAGSRAPGADRLVSAPSLTLPSDLGCPLRLLDDEQFERLAKAAAADAAAGTIYGLQ